MLLYTEAVSCNGEMGINIWTSITVNYKYTYKEFAECKPPPEYVCEPTIHTPLTPFKQKDQSYPKNSISTTKFMSNTSEVLPWSPQYFMSP